MCKRRAGEEKQALFSTKNYQIPEITSEEVGKQLALMKQGKSADAAGIVAEMIKVGGERLRQALAGLFNDILLKDAAPPPEWKHTRIKVLFKYIHIYKNRYIYIYIYKYINI